MTLGIADDTASAFALAQGANNYLNVTTTDGSENMTFGNGLNPSFTFSGTGEATFGGAVTTTGDLSTNGDFTQSGTGTLSTGTGAVTLNGATSVSGTNTFSVGTGATTLGGTLGVTGLATFNGGATVASGQTLTANGSVSINPNAANDIAIALPILSPVRTESYRFRNNEWYCFCLDGSDNVVKCNGAPFGLQAAYNTGNTITTTTGRNIDFTFYDESSDSGVLLPPSL